MDIQKGSPKAIENSAASLITDIYKYDHITPVLQELHWLPVEQQIMYEILIFTLKCRHGVAPVYVEDLLTWRLDTQWKQSMVLIRSDVKFLLVLPR